MNEVDFHSNEITKTGILFGFTTLPMETGNNCKYCKSNPHIYIHTHPTIHLHRYTDTFSYKLYETTFSSHFRSIT